MQRELEAISTETAPFRSLVVSINSTSTKPSIYAGETNTARRALTGDKGRYTQADPLGLTDEPNLFSYAIGNPISFIDEYGLRARLPLPEPPPAEICPRPVPPSGRPGWGARGGLIAILLDVLLTPGELNPIEFENRRPICNPCYEAQGKKKGGWVCRASCNTTVFDRQPDIVYPDRLYGDGVGSTETEACIAAKAAATGSAPRGSYGRHCQCRCRKL